VADAAVEGRADSTDSTRTCGSEGSDAGILRGVDDDAADKVLARRLTIASARSTIRPDMAGLYENSSEEELGERTFSLEV